MMTHYLACDLGAESGRVMLGSLEAGRLTLEEIHRFPNITIRLGNSIRWDILRTFDELKKGLSLVAGRGIPVTSLSVDSWGVDYVWSGLGQELLAAPYTYRDPRTDAPFARALDTVGREKIFSESGLQFMALNTLYQLMSDLEQSPELVRHSEGFLCIADYLNFLFSGIRVAEESLASTTQIYNPTRRAWSEELIAAFGLPKSAFPSLVPSGTVLGPLTESVAEETGLLGCRVVATCSHDTGAAVAAVPAGEENDWAYLSSGTWSLIGVELPAPLINAETLAANFTNEGGFGGTTRFLKNIVGLWILQECRRDWEKAGTTWDYAELNRLAAEATPLRTLINPDDPRFLKPGDMPEKIRTFARETGQPVPESPGQFTRGILESLALLYRHTLTDIEQLTGRTIQKIHIVGGGSQSRLLNQFAADATGRTVLAGPVEATAIGNILVQAIADGKLSDLTELRRTVARSVTVESFSPSGCPDWESAFARFETVRAGK
ncbi:MAG: rhamnulokinase [Chthoniobacterales bacterium]|nr:rhamnulokinase [Chthoniobacterales bacterium]